jgi:hypothetical protein
MTGLIAAPGHQYIGETLILSSIGEEMATRRTFYKISRFFICLQKH